jgi:hypothetical protein
VSVIGSTCCQINWSLVPAGAVDVTVQSPVQIDGVDIPEAARVYDGVLAQQGHVVHAPEHAAVGGPGDEQVLGVQRAERRGGQVLGGKLAARPWPGSPATMGISSMNCGNCRMAPMSLLRIELFFDDEPGNWHYRVPALHINGGGLPSRQDAEKDCLSAIAFALEGNPADYDRSAQALTLDVTVAPAA